jgi:hypothetical protein
LSALPIVMSSVTPIGWLHAEQDRAEALNDNPLAPWLEIGPKRGERVDPWGPWREEAVAVHASVLEGEEPPF